MVEQEHEPRKRLWASRVLAPLLFFLAAILLAILIQNGLRSGDDTETVVTPTFTEPATTIGTTTGPVKKEFYRVKKGDTLESIAAKFDTTVDDLLTLNPDVDPLALSPRQKIRVS